MYARGTSRVAALCARRKYRSSLQRHVYTSHAFAVSGIFCGSQEIVDTRGKEDRGLDIMDAEGQLVM